MAKQLILEKISMCDEQLKGTFFNQQYYSHILDENIDVYDTNGTLILALRKKVIPKYISEIAQDTILTESKKTKTNNRGIASGKIRHDCISKNIVEILQPNNFKSTVRYNNGNISKYKISNTVHSMIIGYYEKPKLVESSTKGPAQSKNGIRLTSFCEHNPIGWCKIISYVQYLDNLYKQLYGVNYDVRYKQIYGNNPNMDKKWGIIDNTIFSTITANYNFRTACHRDEGNLAEPFGYSILVTLGHWNGCFLGYPEYSIAVNVQEGDLLIMNPHIYHCNTEFNGTDNDRLSLVIYARGKIVSKC